MGMGIAVLATGDFRRAHPAQHAAKLFAIFQALDGRIHHGQGVAKLRNPNSYGRSGSGTASVHQDIPQRSLAGTDRNGLATSGNASTDRSDSAGPDRTAHHVTAGAFLRFPRWWATRNAECRYNPPRVRRSVQIRQPADKFRPHHRKYSGAHPTFWSAGE
ncbi:Uncharacterised protein [Salmonella enterica subsp. enterica serovar Typhimurium str. DT104]|nr:Uncharacterised protein [Salmonella enterica subsp. enterica serovar Typhimurium str. DT104]